MAPVDHNPYAAPSSECEADVLASRTRYPGRSFIAMLLAATTAVTAALTGVLWMLGAIDLGRYGVVFLGSLTFATVILVFAAKHYSAGSRYTALGLATIVLCIIAAAVLLALHDAGEIVLF